MDSLTNVEAKVLRLILRGLGSQEIADRTNRSVRTIDGTRGRLLQKFNQSTTIGMIVEALKYGFLKDSMELYFNGGNCREDRDYLTPHEYAVLHELLSGKKTNQIAKSLRLERRGVEHHRAMIKEKWEIDSPVDLVLKAIQKGYVNISASVTNLSKEDTQNIWESFHESLKVDRFKNTIPLYFLNFTYPKYSNIRLSKPQREVLFLRLNGKSNSDIAREMEIAVKSVARHFYNAKNKLGAKTTGNLIAKSIEFGIISVIPPRFRNNSLDEFEMPTIILLSDSMTVPQIARAMSTDSKIINNTIVRLKKRYEVKTIEGILVNALRQGEINSDYL